MALPGVRTIIKDRFYTLSRTDIPAGPRVVILGRRNSEEIDAVKAAEVRSLDVYNAANEQVVIEVFGAGSDLHRGYLEAVIGGAQRVALVALPEDTEFNHTDGYIYSATWEDEAGYSLNETLDTDLLLDAAFEAIEIAEADVVVPWGSGSGATHWQNPATPSDDAEIGFHADNSVDIDKSWAKKIANKCYEITLNSNPCVGVLGVAPYVGVAGSDGNMTPSQVSTHLALSNLVDRDLFVDSFNELDPGETGHYLQVVAVELKPLRYNKDYEFGYANGAATYAGAISQLVSYSAPTGKALVNVEALRYNPTKTQQLAIIDKGVVPVGLTFTRAPAWVDGLTFAKSTSDYTRLTTLRIIYDTVQLVRNVSQQFIGEGATLEAKASLETAITRGLLGMQQQGALLASDFVITYQPAENKALVDLVLTPAFELRNIEVSVSVQL